MNPCFTMGSVCVKWTMMVTCSYLLWLGAYLRTSTILELRAGLGRSHNSGWPQKISWQSMAGYIYTASCAFEVAALGNMFCLLSHGSSVFSNEVTLLLWEVKSCQDWAGCVFFFFYLFFSFFFFLPDWEWEMSTSDTGSSPRSRRWNITVCLSSPVKAHT